MPKYLVETVSIFRMRYVVDCKEAEHASDTVVMNEAKEFSQEHVDECITSVREVKSKEDYLEMFDYDNNYLVNLTEEQKLAFISKVDYDKQR